MKEALFYEKTGNGTLRCDLCPHYCSLQPGYRGICQVRKNIDGILFSTSYGIVSSARFDPVEKKPFYHFYPGKEIFSVGGFGCNLHCVFCQNHNISQVCDVDLPKDNLFTPEEIIKQSQKNQNSCAIAFTYNEPTVNFEFVAETAKAAKLRQIPVALITNGFINKEPLEYILQYIDALNIDLKAFSEDFYRKYTGGGTLPVLETIKTAKEQNKHVEITFLVISGLNDKLSEFNLMVNWIADNIGKNTPFHISRYYPAYKLKTEATQIDILTQLYEIAIKKLDFVYIGNIQNPEYLKTRCPNCYTVLVEREGYNSKISSLTTEGTCSNCARNVNFVL